MNISELLLRRTVPVVINSFNQHYYLENIVNRFLAAGFLNIVIFDNRSTYPPLLGYLNKVRADPRVLPIYYPENLGPHYFFRQHVYRMLGDVPFLYTDPDLDWKFLADDFLLRLFELSRKYKIAKVGAALTLPTPETIKPELPMHYSYGKGYTLLEWEGRFWGEEIEPGVYKADIDTTLHLFNPVHVSSEQTFFTALRVAGPGFEVKHLPWFGDDPCPDDERVFYKGLERFSSWIKKNESGAELP